MDLTGFLTIKYILCLFTTRERKERHYIKTITAENKINNIVIPLAHIGYETVDRIQVGYNYVSYNIEICNDKKLAIENQIINLPGHHNESMILLSEPQHIYAVLV